MSDNKFPAKILQVKSYVDEFGTMYDQYILVESTKSEIFWIFDPKIICDKRIEGQTVTLEFDVWQSAARKNIFKLCNKEKKILLPESPLGTKSLEHYPIFYGEIISKEHEANSNRQLVVDVGSGIIRILVYETEYNSFLVGDYIKVEGNIVHLSEIDGKRI
jgi:hypothetical protein